MGCLRWLYPEPYFPPSNLQEEDGTTGAGTSAAGAGLGGPQPSLGNPQPSLGQRRSTRSGVGSILDGAAAAAADLAAAAAAAPTGHSSTLYVHHTWPAGALMAGQFDELMISDIGSFRFKGSAQVREEIRPWVGWARSLASIRPTALAKETAARKHVTQIRACNKAFKPSHSRGYSKQEPPTCQKNGPNRMQPYFDPTAMFAGAAHGECGPVSPLYASVPTRSATRQGRASARTQQ